MHHPAVARVSSGLHRSLLVSLGSLTLLALAACSDASTTDTASDSSGQRGGGGNSGASQGGSGTSGDDGSGTSGGGGSGGSSGGGQGTDGGGTTTPPNGASPTLAGCDLYPADNPWNQDISSAPVHPNSATYTANMAPTKALHADWGTFSEGYGIPINAGAGAAPVPVSWSTSWGAKESDKHACPSGGGDFCYPIPTNAKIEGGASASSGDDRHLLFLDTTGAPSACTLYELYNTQNYSGGAFEAANGAVFALGSNALRPDGWTSGDAAGLPILPGLVRYDEIAAGAIKHAIRFTIQSSQQGYVHPATHAAGKSNASLPPMGLRVRLKTGTTVSGATPQAQVLITAMKTYGLILADNGSSWFITGETDDRWSGVQSGIQSALGKIHGSDFEAVDTGAISTSNL